MFIDFAVVYIKRETYLLSLVPHTTVLSFMSSSKLGIVGMSKHALTHALCNIASIWAICKLTTVFQVIGNSSVIYIFNLYVN